MAYVVPSVADFRARFPEIVATDALILIAITDASARIDTSWVEADYAPAILFLAAHNIVLDQSGNGSAGIASEGFGGVTVSYRSDQSRYAFTKYGERYYQLLRINKAGPRIIT